MAQKPESEWDRRRRLDDYLARQDAKAQIHREAELDAKVEYATASIREFIKSRPRGGSISFEGGEVKVQLPDLSPEVVSVREAIKRGWL